MTEKKFADLVSEVDRLRRIVVQLQTQAIAQIIGKLCYDSGEGPDHWQGDISEAEDAADTLDKIAAEDRDLQYKIGLHGLRSPWTSIKKWGIRNLGKSGKVEAIDHLRQIISEQDSKDAYGLAQAAAEALRELRPRAGALAP